MNNEEKAKEIANDFYIHGARTYRARVEAAQRMAEWKDDRIQHVIACATANLMATLRHCGLFTEESIIKCAEDFKNDLIKEAKR